MGKRVLPFMVAHPVGAVEDYIITWVVFKNILPYNGMEVMVNTNEAASGGGWNFTGAEIVKHNAPVSIVDTEIFNTNQDLADAVMFD